MFIEQKNLISSQQYILAVQANRVIWKYKIILPSYVDLKCIYFVPAFSF